MTKLVIVILLLGTTSVMAEVGGGDITMKNSGGDVLFSHEKHVVDMELKCTQCHDKLYTDTKQHRKTTMKEMQKGKSCGGCHNGKTAFSVKGDCAKCHKK